MRFIERTVRKLEDKITTTSSEEPALRQSRRWMGAVTWTLITATGASLAWLALARTEEIAVVSGKLEPIGQVQEVRMPVGGVTEAVLVKEGQKVKAGEVLLRLDTASTAGRRSGLMQSIALKQQQLAEKEIELNRYLQLNDTQQATLRNNIRLLEDVVKRLEGLQQQGATPELQLLQERNKLAETRGQLEQTGVDRFRQVALLNQQRQQLASEMAELRSRLNDESVTLRYQEIRSPVAGMVFDLKPTGAGFVAQTSEPVLKIVPQDQLQAAVEIPSRQIGFVRVGQKAEVSIDSYPANDFGVIRGVVKQVSSDALPPDPAKAEEEYRYPGLVQLDQQTLKLRDGRKLALQAGMSLQAHIQLRSVSYLQLLLGSFRDKADSLRQL
jgi:hemolysin D